MWRQESVVGIKSWLSDGRSLVQFPADVRVLLFPPKRLDGGLGPPPPPASYLMGTCVNSPGVKYQGGEVDPSLPSSLEVKNEWNPVPTLPL